MKGTFYSADFVSDLNADPRLLEINTDTGYASTTDLTGVFDWTEFIDVLGTNAITELTVVYKPSIQDNIFLNLSQSVAVNAPFITAINEIKVNGDSIFPPSPVDRPDLFILRMAYDETAILDSEYAKNNLNLLTLFANAGDTGSTVTFYHSSSLYGYYNTLDLSTNIQNVPDLVVKPVIFDNTPAHFYKLGKPGETIEARYAEFEQVVGNDANIIENYFLNDNYAEINKTTSIRTYNIVYGPELDSIMVASYEIPSLFEIPTSLEVDDSVIDSSVALRHYYEFATNTINNTRHGLLKDETVYDMDGNKIPIYTMQTGSLYPSYYVEGAPNTDDEDILDSWYITGSTLPSGSHVTSSVCSFLTEFTTYANDVVRVTLEDGDVVELGGGNRLLVYNSANNEISYTKLFNLTTDCYVWDSDGNMVKVIGVDFEILEEPGTLYAPNMENVDSFLIGENKVLRLVAHNAIFGVCFDENCLVEMFNGSQKRISDIEVGDLVKSFYKGEFVSGKVTATLPHAVNGIVNMVKKGGLIGDSKHPILVDGEWKYAENLKDAEHYQAYYNTLYNLEIDGDNPYGSEHNYIIDGHICSGLGDNVLLNIEFARQEKHLLPYLNK